MNSATGFRSVDNEVPGEGEVLSPESYVFVALMSVEEGPNKASFLQVPRAVAIPPVASEAGPAE
jgi:hypothetical protein